MSESERLRREARTVTLVGLVSLASAMGIGRFAFTPLLPLMLGVDGFSLAQSAWVASANYLGYLAGAAASWILAFRASPAARWGLAAVAVTTLAGAVAHSVAAWIAVRFAAGMASAFVLIGASDWALAALARRRRMQWAGWAFAGVGTGIFLAGLTSLVGASIGASARSLWAALGVLAAIAAALTWRPLASTQYSTPKAVAGAERRLDAAGWILIGCYGAFGFGYILPATFIPAAAHAVVQDPAQFAWAWPLFGLAAAVSTVVVSAFVPLGARPRVVAGWSLVVMAFGVFLTAIGGSLETLCTAAVCVGGTFMVATMSCLQDARRIGGNSPGRLIAAMTAAFAVGQLAGPLTVGSNKSVGNALALPGAIAAAILLLAGVILLALRSESHPARVTAVHSGKCK
jgi:predicted MFS family arabinose efflux permease